MPRRGAARTWAVSSLIVGCEKAHVPVMVEGYQVDALWREPMVIVELDSFAHHRGRTAFEGDREKICALQLAEYRVLPITWRRLEREPAVVAATIRTLLEAEAAPPAPAASRMPGRASRR